MNAYDFDGTIYRGDSTLDFYFFCLLRHPKAIRHLPRQAWGALRFMMGRIDKTQMKQIFYSFLLDIQDMPAMLDQFWVKKWHKIELWYLAQKRDDDIILSASPTFLLAPACERLNIAEPIASVVNPENGRYSGINCSGEEKVRRFRERYGSITPDTFYSDSHGDRPMARAAACSFFVRGGKPRPWMLS